jgi:hypothetical protein
MSPHPKNIFTNSFKHFESIVTQWRMFFKMSVWIVTVLFVAQCITLYIIYKHSPQRYLRNLSANDLCVFRSYTLQSLREKYLPFKEDFSFEYKCGGGLVNVQYSRFKAIYQHRYEEYIVPTLKKNTQNVFLPSCFIYLLYFLVLYIFSKNHQRNNKDKYIRGTVSESQEKISQVLNNFDRSYKFRINDYISIPESILTRHNFIIGKTGSGKSTLLYKFIAQIIDRNLKCVIHDYKGDFVPHFYDAKRHYIFNPLDVRHMALNDSKSSISGWTIFNDLHTEPDVESFVKSLIPENRNADPIWHTAPRDLLYSIIIFCMKAGINTNKQLYDMILETPERLKQILSEIPEGRVALKHLEDPKLSGQFNSIVATFTAPFHYLSGTDGNFSIEKWVADPKPDKNVIFVSNQAKVRATLQKLIATFFDFSITNLNSLPDNQNRRLYYILDEFPQLGKLDSIIDLLTVSRSKGGAAFVISQNTHLISSLYGSDLSTTIINNCGNKFMFAVDDGPSAEVISKQLGSTEIERTKESKTFGVNDLRDSISINSEIVERRIALPAEIMNQKTLSFYMKLTDIPLTHVDIEYVDYPYKSNPYESRNFTIERNVLNASSILAKINEMKKKGGSDQIGAIKGDSFFAQCGPMVSPSDEEIVPPEYIPPDTEYRKLDENSIVVNDPFAEQLESAS